MVLLHRPLALCLMLSIAVFSVPLASDAEATGCVPELVPALGLACLRADGLYEVYDTDGRLLALTHGHDPPPDLEAQTHTSPPPRVALSCTDPDSRPFHVLLILAEPSDGGTIGMSDTQLLTLAEQANGAFQEAASRFGGSRSLWTLCEDGTPIVHRLTLNTPMAQTTFSTVQRDLELLGFVDKRVKHWVWFSGHPPGSPGGTGAIESDEQRSIGNRNNGNAGRIHVAITWGYNSWSIMAHELGHNLGAVQNGAPNSSGAWHCNDGYDVMCYGDGGPKSAYRNNVCSVQRIDCNNNDYFHTAPPAGSYLATRWNLGDPLVRYFEGCHSTTGTLTAGAPGVRVEGVSMHTWNVPSACAGETRYVLEAYPPLSGFVGLTYNIDVCFDDAAGMELSCSVGFGHFETGDVPADATTARVFADRGVDVHYDLRMG